MREELNLCEAKTKTHSRFCHLLHAKGRETARGFQFRFPLYEPSHCHVLHLLRQTLVLHPYSPGREVDEECGWDAGGRGCGQWKAVQGLKIGVG